MRCEPGWCWLSVSVADKENEISAVKDLLTPVYVKDRVWTADAIHTQKTACQRIDQLGGKYLLFFKDNHPTAHEDLARFFQDPDADQSTWGVFSQTDKGHGRLTTRTVRTSTEMNDWFANEWAGIAQSFQIMRTVKGKIKLFTYTIDDIALAHARLMDGKLLLATYAREPSAQRRSRALQVLGRH